MADLQNVYDSMPKKIQIGVYTFKISTPEEIKFADPARIIWGQTDKANGEIQVSRKNWSKEMVVSTFLHECGHACVFAQAPVRIKNEEDFCLALETAMVNLLKQNPKLLDWIKDTLHG